MTTARTDNEKAVRRLQWLTGGVVLLNVLFALFFDRTKHVPALEAANPFDQDPFDAVGSFGVQVALLAALLAALRLVRPYAGGVLPAAARGLVLRGDAVALLSIGVTLTADLTALMRYPGIWVTTAPGRALAVATLVFWLLTGAALGATVRGAAPEPGTLRPHRSWTIPAAVCLVGLPVLAGYPPAWRETVPGAILAAATGMGFLFLETAALAHALFPPPPEDHEDLLDDLCALWQGFGWRIFGLHPEDREAGTLPPAHGPTVRGYRRALAWLSLRHHPWRLAAVVGVALGAAMALAEFLGEGVAGSPPGAPYRVAAAFISLEGTGVLLGYVLLGRLLGLFRPE